MPKKGRGSGRFLWKIQSNDYPQIGKDVYGSTELDRLIDEDGWEGRGWLIWLRRCKPRRFARGERSVYNSSSP